MATQVMAQRSQVDAALVVPLAQVGIGAVAQVGGKNASLGEMIRELSREGVQVPGGFATTALAYRNLLAANRLVEPLKGLLGQLDTRDLQALQAAGLGARRLVLNASLPQELEQAIVAAYAELGAPAVAVRSSATAEDLPEASFAGQQETFLHIQGDRALLEACRRCYASLFTDRAIVYRQQHGYDHLEVALSIGVQRMVRSDLACSGVMFSIDTENVVQGVVNPDEFLIHKPTLELGFAPIVCKRLGSKNLRLVLTPPGSAEAQAGQPVRNEPVPLADQERYALSDQEALQLARWAVLVERHYSAKRGAQTPMDLEWAKDGISGELFILQARPETVQSQRGQAVLKTWRLDPHQVVPLARGSAIGTAASHGRARVIGDPSEIERFGQGDVLVTGRTDPDWEPILKKARGVITDQGGRTCHAAIIAREMGITAVVGTGDGTSRIRDGQIVTLSCCEGEEGRVYPGHVPYSRPSTICPPPGPRS